MEMIELSKIVSAEKKVIQYLQQKAILKKFDSCPYCGSIHIGSLEGEVDMDESYFGGKRKGKRGRGRRDRGVSTA